MLTLAFLLAGAFSFLVAAAVTIWRFVLERRNILEPPAWDSTLSLINALLAMLFFSLGIYRTIQPGSADDLAATTTPQVEVAATVPAPGATVILVPLPGPWQTPGAALPTNTPQPPIVLQPEQGNNREPTPTPVSPAVQIATPQDGATVSPSARVEGTSQGVRPGQAPGSPRPWVYITVRLNQGGTTTWWVQPYPVVEPTGRWSAFLSLGVSNIVSGTSFDICAIVSNDSLPPGQRSQEPRALSRNCVTVQAA